MSRYLVLGAGGVGGLLASQLSAAGIETAIVARQATVAKVRERGLIVVDIEGGETVTRRRRLSLSPMQGLGLTTSSY
jgi:ketopantoate reductase